MNKIHDYAYSRSKTVTRKQTILAALDALIGGFLLVIFLGMTLLVGWLIFGH